jgi:hypothetical protein
VISARRGSEGIAARRAVLLRLAPALLLLVAGLARADDPCAEDVQRLCPGVKPGGGRLAACLRQHEAELGEACRERREADALRVRRVIQEFGLACRTDVDRYCPAVEPGSGRVLGCLAQHQVEISTACQGQLQRLTDARDRVSALKAACTSDVERLCADVSPRIGPLLECLEANEERLSAACNAGDVRAAVQAGVLVDTLEQMTSQEHIRESLEILQGLDTVAFSRSQLLFQMDGYQSLGERANGVRFLFNPQFVFGDRGQFALQVKLPMSALFPYAAGAPTQFGLGAVTGAFAWNFWGEGRVRQFLAVGLQCATASTPVIGGPWAVVPSYAIGAAVQRWLAVTVQVQWIRSLGASGTYPTLNMLILEPIVAVNLPGRSFLALDTRLGWDFTSGTLLPLMKGMAGIFTDRQKSLSVSVWYQATLSQPAAAQLYKYEVGTGLAYFFDW